MDPCDGQADGASSPGELPAQAGVAKDPPVREKSGVDEPRHLLIDGYNVLYAWHWLRPGHDAGPALDAARSRLIEAVRAVRDVDRCEVTLVFDGRGATTQLDAGATEPGFAVVFAPTNRTADNVIEALVAAAPHPHACTVATADALERETVAAAGAACLSPEDLLAWCERCRARASQNIARRAAQSRASWGNKIPL